MKRLLSVVTLLATTTAAGAADLAMAYPVKAVAVVAPVFSWTGFYLGANAGYGGGSFDISWPAVGRYPSGYANDNASGFFAGGQIGYNYQFANNVVIGIETDLQWSDVGTSRQVSMTGLPASYQNVQNTVDYFGTVRARMGYAFGTFLPYATGGLAYGKVSRSVTAVDGYVANTNDTPVGWTLGAGAEYAFTPNWTLKTEYLYVDLGSATFSDRSLNTAFNTLKAGVNYKF